MLRGIGFRAGRSLLVLLIATIATASAVATAGYIRASQASVLADALKYGPGYQTDVVMTTTGSNGNMASFQDAQLQISQERGNRPLLRQILGTPIYAEDSEMYIGSDDSHAGLGWFAYRGGVCAHLTITGNCASAPGQVMVSTRSAARFGWKVGDTIYINGEVNVISPPGSRDAVRQHAEVISGLYTPTNLDDPYWAGNAYFSDGPDSKSPTQIRFDSVFSAVPDDVEIAASTLYLHVEIPIRLSAVNLDNVDAMRSDLKAFAADSGHKSFLVDSGVTIVLDQAAAEQHSLATTIPVVAVPLVVLCLFVLFLVVTALTEERTPELALAKLRGYPSGRAARFGMAEMLALIAVAMPLGIVAGLALTEGASDAILASGVHAEFRLPILLTGLGAMLAGFAAAWLATRSTLRRGVLALMRRVPSRTGWKAGVGVGVALAFVAASLVAAFLNRSSPIAWLAAPSIALIAGVLASRMLAFVSGRRLRSAVKRGRVVSLLSGAWLARQPGRNRVVAVLTVAVALLVFGAVGWDVGTRARTDNAQDTLGAAHVYRVVPIYPTALENAVRTADPSGNSMAVVEERQYYNRGYVTMVGVQAPLFSKVAVWRGHSASDMDATAKLLRPVTAKSLIVTGSMTIHADVTAVSGAPVEMSALVSPSGGAPTSQPLGILAKGTSAYTGLLGGCQDGCRLLGIAIGRTAGPSQEADATMDITSITSGDVSVSDFPDADWAPDETRAPDAHLQVSAGTALHVTLATTDPTDALISYQDTPVSLPVVVSGGAKAEDPDASAFSFPGLSANPGPMTVVGRTAVVPNGGTDAILFDLDTATGVAGRSGSLADVTNLEYEVWTNGSAPADFAKRLTGAGVTILSADSIDDYLTRLSRGAPTLAMWFYLVAGGLALLLAVGVVLLGAYVGATTRIYEYASLKVVGVKPNLIRRAVLREYRSILGIALVVGVAAGLGGAIVMLPGIPLVTVDGPVGDVPYDTRMPAVYVALGITVVALGAVMVLAMRVLRRATPERLREGVR
jgi:ABC-type antimicrobial peptide transport system permease subunit